MIEIWKPIGGFPGYEISDQGRVRSYYLLGGTRELQTSPQLIRKQYFQKRYYWIALQRNGKFYNKSVSRLVAQTFIPNPEQKPQVNHKNGNRKDNRAENLEWCTPSENAQHALNLGLRPTGEAAPQSKLTAESVQAIRRRYAQGNISQSKLGREYGVLQQTISKIVRHVKWAYLD